MNTKIDHFRTNCSFVWALHFEKKLEKKKKNLEKENKTWSKQNTSLPLPVKNGALPEIVQSGGFAYNQGHAERKKIMK